MRSVWENDTIQIEVTNSCLNRCANCTRFVGHVTPYFMNFGQFKQAVDSLVGFPKMVGFQGGEVLLHPEFEKFCKYALSKIPREQLGLWTTLPVGYEKYREIICETFGNIFINDHSRSDIYHHPFLVAIDEVSQDKNMMFVEIDRCYFQHEWSASINPKGAYFCEMAASLSLLFPKMNKGWDVEKDWWWKTPKDYKKQIEEFCPRCGGALKIKRRVSADTVDDISPRNLERLKDSPKIKANKYVIHDLTLTGEMETLAAYKDQSYRDRIANRYGIYLTHNPLDFNEPHLSRGIKTTRVLMDTLRERYG